MRPVFFLREALRSIRRNAVPSFAAIASVLVTMLVLGVFIPVVQATTGAANDVRSRVLVDVYLKKSAKPADVARVRALLTGHVPDVGRVDYLSARQAYQQQKKLHPEAYQLLGANPLPDTFRISPKNPDQIGQIRTALLQANDESIDKVQYKRDDTQKILTATRVVKLAMALLAILLVLASILLISNTIRLSLFARRREVEVMKLVGATDWFIRWPFVIEGVLLGALGGLVAILLLAVGKIALVDPLAHDFALIAAPRTIAFPLLVFVLVVASVAVSAAGSGLSLRRFLKV